MGSVWKGVDWEEREGLESLVAKGSQVHPPCSPFPFLKYFIGVRRRRGSSDCVTAGGRGKISAHWSVLRREGKTIK